MEKFITITIFGIRIINTTICPINFLTETGAVLAAPPSGAVLEATKEQVPGDIRFKVQIIKTKFSPDVVSEKILAQIEEEYPDTLILGTTLTAQMFPGRVFAPIAYPGFENIAAAERKMTLERFMSF